MPPVNKSSPKKRNEIPDRLGLTYSRKVQVANYEPVEVSFYYESSVRRGESVDSAIKRVTKVVQKKMTEEVRPLLRLKKKNKN